MATLILSAAGAALGANIGGSVLGLSGAVLGRAAGATLGRLIDQRLLGQGSAAVDTGRIERLRLTGAGEGVPLPRLWGRLKLPGHVIWASNFEEHPGTSARSKGGFGPRVSTETRYTISLAVALCEGEITGLGRIWAFGDEIARRDLNLRLYPGSDDQAPDPKIEAVEGPGNAPAYRGTAYVVIEDLDLAPWGNRVPALAFEVFRAARAEGQTVLQDAVQAVAWMPGSGEYALATEPVLLLAEGAAGQEPRQANVNTPAQIPDFEAALQSLTDELPAVHSGLFIVSWFGDDLRCGECQIRPKIEFAAQEGQNQPWSVGGLTRGQTEELEAPEGSPVYGGTPSDTSVLQGIAAMHEAGQKVVYYPFILMEQLAGNGLPDPWTGAEHQPVLPWRGRITLSIAPGREGSPDRSAASEAEVAAFFGTAQPGDFTIDEGSVSYAGPDEWSYRRFILHQAALCAAAGGVDAFCIGSEMVALTQIRGAGDSFPAVTALRDLLHDVRAMLGPDVKLTYAADWSEYFGYNDGAGNRYFHLDPLWSDPDCDFIGIDNYMPLSDWREGEDHLDAQAGWRGVHDLDYLKANVAGGEGYDWFYASDHARTQQERTLITDGADGEPWIWRYKDLGNWWSNPHYERFDGVRELEPTDWEPRSKPIWFTELGCAAIDKGTNQPNKFLDPKSSESAIPYFSNGHRDDAMQMQYLRAMADYWNDPANNPPSDIYEGRMLDWSRAHVWAWDARPFPWFPGNAALWGDAPNWARGHWLTGRATNQPLAAVVAEICTRTGVADFDVSGLFGVVRGYGLASTETPRAMLQPLMLAHGIEAVEREGRLVFRHRDGRPAGALEPGELVARQGGDLERLRASQPETVNRVRLTYIEAEADYDTRSAETVHPEDALGSTVQSEMALLLTRGEARTIVARWMAEARVARDQARFALPPSAPWQAGDVLTLAAPQGARHYRIDRIEQTGVQEIEAVRIEPGIYRGGDAADDDVPARSFLAPVPVTPLFLDLPLLRDDAVPQAPHLAVTARPWPGRVVVHDAPLSEGEFAFNSFFPQRATIGQTLAPLARARPALWWRGPPLLVQFPPSASLASATPAAVLEGANLLAIGDGADWELLQFAEAELVAPGVWQIATLLRGQFGTDALMPDNWPSGAPVVLIDGAVQQIALPLAARGLERRYRIGPASRPLDEPVHVERIVAFDGVGLRPYAPVHLRARRIGSGAPLDINWIRRTRLGGDSWQGMDVPLGEENERYLLRIIQHDTILREVETTAPQWSYPTSLQAADGISGPFSVAVAQLSGSFGPGLFARVEVPG